MIQNQTLKKVTWQILIFLVILTKMFSEVLYFSGFPAECVKAINYTNLRQKSLKLKQDWSFLMHTCFLNLNHIKTFLKFKHQFFMRIAEKI